MLNNNDAARAEPLMGDDLSAGKEAATTVDVDAVAEPQKSDSPFRWVVLFFSCLALMGNYYCFDNPGAMKTALDEYVGLSEVQYSLLYTIYSLPNVILPFFGKIATWHLAGICKAFKLFVWPEITRHSLLFAIIFIFRRLSLRRARRISRVCPFRGNPSSRPNCLCVWDLGQIHWLHVPRPVHLWPGWRKHVRRGFCYFG